MIDLRSATIFPIDADHNSADSAGWQDPIPDRDTVHTAWHDQLLLQTFLPDLNVQSDRGSFGGVLIQQHLDSVGTLAEDIENFELKFRYRFPGKGNSGVNIRARNDPTGKRDFQAYHADLGHVGIGKRILGAWDFHTPGRTEHACYRGDRLVIDANDQPTITKIKDAVTIQEIHKGDGNEARIVAKGNHFQLFINGQLSSELIENLNPNAVWTKA